MLLTNDSAQESPETFTVALSSPTNASAGTPASATVTILDDDMAAPTPYDETYAYDTVGNLTLKGPTGNGKTYSYAAQSASCPTGALVKRHAVVNDGTTSYCYDQNGNMLSGSGRSYVWDAENRPTSITNGALTESYSYDADGEWV